VPWPGQTVWRDRLSLFAGRHGLALADARRARWTPSPPLSRHAGHCKNVFVGPIKYYLI